MKNAALLGGALAFAAVEEPWPLSIPNARSGETLTGLSHCHLTILSNALKHSFPV